MDWLFSFTQPPISSPYHIMTPTTITLVARAWLVAAFAAQVYAIYVVATYQFTLHWALNWFLLALPVASLVLLVQATHARFTYVFAGPEHYQSSVRLWPVMRVVLFVWWTVCAFLVLADSIKSCSGDTTGLWRVVRWVCETQDRGVLMLANVVACSLFGVIALAVKGVAEQTHADVTGGEAKDEEKVSASSLSEVV